jgi:hypothetical protein
MSCDIAKLAGEIAELFEKRPSNYPQNLLQLEIMEILVGNGLNRK